MNMDQDGAPVFSVTWYDAGTDEEIDQEQMNFSYLGIRPVVGDEVHYWQDGTPDNAGGGGLNRRDYVVTRVRHDLRYMPSRGGRAMHVQSLEVWVR